nr:cell wall protein DAN4-like [Biomphalaria glabrata]
MLLRILFLACCLTFNLVNSQLCSKIYEECSWMVQCCSNPNNPLRCLQAVNFRYYCYPESDYLPLWAIQMAVISDWDKK